MVNIRGQLVNKETGEVVPFAYVINLRIHGGTIADDNGFFSLQADTRDTLMIKSVGFSTLYINVNNYLENIDKIQKIKLSPVKYLIPEVDVEGKMPEVNMQGIPIGKQSDVPIELRSDDFSSNPHWTSAVLKPFSFLHYKFSKKEKRKRKARATIQTQQEWEYFSLVYNKEILERLTGLSGDELDDFMVYCNANHGLHYSASSYEVEDKVKQLFKVYKEFYLVNSD
jgi:hypothetical protein